MATQAAHHTSGSMCLRVPVLVHRGRADGGSASILLYVGLGPAAEGLEVRERRIVVVVSVPQREVLELGRAAHDGAPLTGAGVDAHGDASFLALVHHLLEEVDIVGSVAAPVLSAFDIKPDHAVLRSGKSVHGIIHLYIMATIIQILMVFH